jgi:hypothetical protein
MTRQERHDEVVRMAGNLGLTVEPAGALGKIANDWYISGPDGHRGTLVYNQRSGVWSALGGSLSKRHYGELGGLLNLFACSPSPRRQEPGAQKPS